MLLQWRVPPVSQDQADLSFNTNGFQKFVRLCTPMDSSSSYSVTNLYFDDGISVGQTDAHGNTCTVKLKVSNVVITAKVMPGHGCRVMKDGTIEPGLFYFVNFDVVKVVECKFSGRRNWYKGREMDFPLAKTVSEFKTVHLMLPPHDDLGPGPHREPESMIAHLKYVASNKAGHTTQAIWSSIFEPTPVKSKSEQNRGCSKAERQQGRYRETANPKGNCDSSITYHRQMEERIGHLEKKLKEMESKETVGNRKYKQQEKPHAQETREPSQKDPGPDIDRLAFLFGLDE
jgi:hypothetical protein